MSGAVLSWDPGASVPEDRRRALMGPGAAFEMVPEVVLGTSQTVFARRLPHLRALLDEGVQAFAEDPWLVHSSGAVTFGEAALQIAGAAESLAQMGIGRGDRVALAAATRYEHAIMAWAVIAAGATVVGLNAWWAAPEMEYGISITRPKLLIGDAPRLARLQGRVPDLPTFDLEEVADTWFRRPAAMPTTPIDEDDPFVILFTSGTTGRPKAAALSHRNNINWIQAIALRSAMSGRSAARSCEIAATPMFHISGLNSQAIASVAVGTRLVFPDPPGRWSAEAHLALSERHGVTSWRLVPAQGWKLVEEPSAPQRHLSDLRSIAFGGSFVSHELLHRLVETWPQAAPGIVVGFGMTETNGTGASGYLDEVLAAPGCVGRPSPGTELRIWDPARHELAPEATVGEVHIRSASVFLGYEGDHEASRAVLDDERWYRTGDFGRIEDGRLILEGRRSDLIIRGGENIYPREIEDRLTAHPDVTEAVVIGVPDRVLGEVVKAVVVRRSGSHVDADGIRGWVGAALAPFKVPALVQFRPSIPHNALGKPLRHLLDDDADGPSPFLEE